MRPAMRVGMHYVVTRASRNGEFKIGDHVWLETDGAIMCREAGGWMPAEDVEEATEGWAIELDQKWLAENRKKLEELLAGL